MQRVLHKKIPPFINIYLTDESDTTHYFYLIVFYYYPHPYEPPCVTGGFESLHVQFYNILLQYALTHFILGQLLNKTVYVHTYIGRK